MIHTQRDSHESNDRFYAYRPCGVVGRLRRERKDAETDDGVHTSVCSTRGRE